MTNAIKTGPLKGYRRVLTSKSNEFPEVKPWRKVVHATLLAPGMPPVMFTVDKYAKGWGKSYKTYEPALQAQPAKYWN